jgi:O-antigen ligase
MRTFSFWLSLIVIFMIPWQNMDMINIGHPVTVIRIVVFLVTVFWVATVIVTGRFRKPHPFHAAVYLYVLWNVVSAFWSFDVGKTVERILIYSQLVSLVWILWDLYRSPAALKAGLQAYVLGAYVPIGGTVLNYLTSKEAAIIRYAASGTDSNELSLVLALGIPVAWHLALSEGNSKKTHLLRLVNYAYILAATFAILLTASRGSFLATLPAFLFVLGSLTRLKLFQRALILAALIGALFVLLPLVPQSSFQRLGTIGPSIAEWHMGGRGDVWLAGIAAFPEHPLLGVGSGAFHTVVKTGASAHNVFLSALVEVGLIGFVLFVFILAIVVCQAVHQPKWDARLWLTILLVWAIGASAVSWDRTNQTWLFLGLAVVSAGLPGRRDEAVTQVMRQTP